MKKSICLSLVCLLLALSLTGCGFNQNAVTPVVEETRQAVNFAPETTAVATEGLAAALASVGGATSIDEETEMALKALEPMRSTEPTEEGGEGADEAAGDAGEETVEVTPAPTKKSGKNVQPLTTATPQPNTNIANYSQIGGTGLGFSFSYPSGWENIPGRSTVCYLQPIENGTIYPARVSVSVKELPHPCNMTRLEEQMVEFTKTLLKQYDEETFIVEPDLESGISFMGSKNSLATTYLAYDGAQEIEGYFIMTYYERYVFCYHFVCAYEDYEAFNSAMLRMRDSVAPEETELVYEDD